MDPDEDLCSVQRAGRLLGWSESKIRRHKDALGGREGGNGRLGLSLAVVLRERAKILSELGAVEQPGLDTQARAGDGEAVCDIAWQRAAAGDWTTYAAEVSLWVPDIRPRRRPGVI